MDKNSTKKDKKLRQDETSNFEHKGTKQEPKISLDHFAVSEGLSSSRKYYLEYIIRHENKPLKTEAEWKKLLNKK